MMQKMGIKNYRFSISWTRILPDGTGAVNQKGIQFYSDLVDALLEAGITPMVTLFHWDYPYALHQKGGWLNPDSSDWFVDYAKVVVDALSDRVTYWMTINEPQVFMQSANLLRSRSFQQEIWLRCPTMFCWHTARP